MTRRQLLDVLALAVLFLVCVLGGLIVGTWWS